MVGRALPIADLYRRLTPNAVPGGTSGLSTFTLGGLHEALEKTEEMEVAFARQLKEEDTPQLTSRLTEPNVLSQDRIQGQEPTQINKGFRYGKNH